MSTWGVTWFVVSMLCSSVIAATRLPTDLQRQPRRDSAESFPENDIIARKFETVSRMVACSITIIRKRFVPR